MSWWSAPLRWVRGDSPPSEIKEFELKTISVGGRVVPANEDHLPHPVDDEEESPPPSSTTKVDIGVQHEELVVEVDEEVHRSKASEIEEVDDDALFSETTEIKEVADIQSPEVRVIPSEIKICAKGILIGHQIYDLYDEQGNPITDPKQLEEMLNLIIKTLNDEHLEMAEQFEKEVQGKTVRKAIEDGDADTISFHDTSVTITDNDWEHPYEISDPSSDLESCSQYSDLYNTTMIDLYEKQREVQEQLAREIITEFQDAATQVTHSLVDFNNPTIEKTIQSCCRQAVTLSKSEEPLSERLKRLRTIIDMLERAFETTRQQKEQTMLHNLRTDLLTRYSNLEDSIRKYNLYFTSRTTSPNPSSLTPEALAKLTTREDIEGEIPEEVRSESSSSSSSISASLYSTHSHFSEDRESSHSGE